MPSPPKMLAARSSSWAGDGAGLGVGDGVGVVVGDAVGEVGEVVGANVKHWVVSSVPVPVQGKFSSSGSGQLDQHCDRFWLFSIPVPSQMRPER